MKCENTNCNNETELRSRGNIYKKYCSDKCRIQHSHIKTANTRKSKRPEGWIGDGKCKNEGCINNTFITVKGKYSLYCSLECKKTGVLRKLKTTNLEKYGVENPATTGAIKDKIKGIFDEKYGGHPMFNNAIKEKIKKTNIERYGVESTLSSNLVRSKIKKTNLEKYGVENASQKDISKESLCTLNDKEKMSKLFSNSSITGIASALGVSISTVKLRLVEHGIYSVKNSSFEKHIMRFLHENSINFISNSRSIIKPLELDIYIPEFNLAIECNGDYWHSELQGKDRNYHLNKTLLCKKSGVDLLHIYEHEWEYNTNIVKSMILSKLKKLNKIYARKCEIREVSSEAERIFIDNNHIQGYVRSSYCLGLYYNSELVSIISFGKSRFSKHEYELLRFCNKNNTVVVGGASKLFSHFVRLYNPKSIISYSHRDKFTGNLYKKLGFEYSHSSSPSYYYTNNYINFENRLKYQKHRLPKLLENFDADLTEWENMQVNGYDRIWDCGNDVWLWKI